MLLSLGKSLSDDQTLPNHQFSVQSEPGTLEQPADGTKTKEAAGMTKLSSGECCRAFFNPGN